MTLLTPLLASLGALLVAFIYHSDKVMGVHWRAAANFSPEQEAKMKSEGMWRPTLGQFVIYYAQASALIMLHTLIIPLTEGNPLPIFLSAIAVIWLAFVLAGSASEVLWEKRSWVLHALNSLGSLLSTATMAGIIYWLL